MKQEDQQALLKRITVEPDKCSGKPCIRGYRMRVGHVSSYLAAGMSEAEILEEFSFLEHEDITACLLYASHSVDHTSADVA